MLFKGCLILGIFLLIDVGITNATIALSPTVSDFANGCFNALISQTTGSTLFSPIFIQNLLALLYAGSKGETAQVYQIGGFFGGASQMGAANEFQQLLLPLENPEVGLNIANVLFVEVGTPVIPKFKQMATQQFFTEIEQIDFETKDPSSAINSYIATITTNQMLSVVPPGAFSAYSNMMAFSGVAFNGAWEHEFNPANTVNQSFYADCSNKVVQQIPMMSQTAFLKYAVYDNLGAQIVQMPFRSSNLTMFIIMPVKCQNFNQMQQALDDFDLTALNGGQYHNVNLVLPRFAAAVSFELNSVMSYFNMQDIFSPGADYTGVSKSTLELSAIIQHASINITETGATAFNASDITSSATATKGSDNSAPIPFIVNRPFLYIITSPSSIVYMGRYVGENPTFVSSSAHS